MTDNVDLSDIVEAIGRTSGFGPVGDLKRIEYDERNELHPSEGRVIKTTDKPAPWNEQIVLFGNGDDWLVVDDEVGFKTASHYTDELSGVFDRRVATTSQLESLPSDIQAGETVLIQQPATPYRPASWPSGGKYGEIDVSNIRIVCESAYAENGEAIVKAADGADIGGLIVGNNSAVEDVTVERCGWHGNQANQDSTVKRLHGLIFDQVTDGTIEDCFITRTSPYQEHGSGGTGIVLTENTLGCTVEGNLIDDIGDRSISVCGDEHVVTENRCINGYDRGISLQYQGLTGGDWFVAQDVTVSDNFIKDMSDGSAIKGRGSEGQAATSRVLENITVTGNVIRGRFNEAVGFDQLQSDQQPIVIDGNTAVHASSNAARAAYRVAGTGGSTPDTVVISNNVSLNSTGHGIEVDGIGNAVIEGNTIRNPSESGIFATGSSTGNQISDNTIQNPTNHGIVLDIVVKYDISDNIIRAADWGVDVVGGSDHDVTDNRIYAGGSGGVRIDSNNSETVVILNDLRESGTTALSDSGTGTITDPVNQNKTEDWNVT